MTMTALFSNWMLLSSLSFLLFVISNLLDQFMARVYFHASATSYLILSGFASMPIAASMAFFHPEILDIGRAQAVSLIALAWLNSAHVYFFIRAVQRDDVSRAVPLYHMIPIFVFFLGYIFLGEQITMRQLAGAALVIASAFCISINFKTLQFHTYTFVMMALSSLVYSVYVIIVRVHAADIEPVAIGFWLIVGWILLSFSLSAFHPRARQAVIDNLRLHPAKLPLVVFSEKLVSNIAYVLSAAALAIAPSAGLSDTMRGLSPIYAILLGGLCGLIWPRIYDRIEFDRTLLVKLACAVVMFCGIWLIY
jgi:drug/metabolite transporter (DMT)-like permease